MQQVPHAMPPPDSPPGPHPEAPRASAQAAALHWQPNAEDQARADMHALTARLLLSPPDAALLQAIAHADALDAQQADNPLEAAWDRLRDASRAMDEAAVRDEYSQLFVSLGTPPVNPYGSVYIAGFAMEKPLAALRRDLAELGLARRTDVGELEDHLGVLCETMRILIGGAPGLMPQPLAVQNRFFSDHIAPWYAACLQHLRSANGSNYYRCVADFAEAFLDLEAEAFAMEDERAPDG